MRNKANHKKNRAKPEELYFLLQKYVADWRKFCACPGKVRVLTQPRWAKLNVDKVKINIDGAFNASNQSSGWGCVARDPTGDVLFAVAGKIEQVSDALHAEATALLNAINLAEDHGMGCVIFETDCLGLAQAINTTVLDRSALGALFRETRFLLQMGFSEWSVIHCPRACNKPAHEMAAIGKCNSYMGHRI